MTIKVDSTAEYTVTLGLTEQEARLLRAMLGNRIHSHVVGAITGALSVPPRAQKDPKTVDEGTRLFADIAHQLEHAIAAGEKQ
jgi:hypothetical protein